MFHRCIFPEKNQFLKLLLICGYRLLKERNNASFPHEFYLSFFVWYSSPEGELIEESEKSTDGNVSKILEVDKSEERKNETKDVLLSSSSESADETGIVTGNFLHLHPSLCCRSFSLCLFCLTEKGLPMSQLIKCLVNWSAPPLIWLIFVN